eukprot:CAMPEP_0201594148 /NCGR_PEP_ID=MMETSP0190_2-20130828/191550_1 /ASSEMBLY_ACC=CAM_ASM_000263 /TAXON_ID=37353 /ORGANISM="Rosalina sp." /LENGTH=188 /DNA_ID=CAMNT_0048053639 /DNA_START=1 /DNA_END=568 /DNA_ORIENTATION=+
MANLIELSLDLIKNHGSYSEIVNSCQDFVINFARKCADKDAKFCRTDGTGGSLASVGAGAGLGSLGGAAFGAVVAGPPGAIVGSFYGAQGGAGVGLGSFAVGKSFHSNQSDKVKLKDDTDELCLIFVSGKGNTGGSLAVMGAGAGLGSLGGALPGAVVGATIGAGSFAVAKSYHNNESDKVQLKDDKE